MAFGLSANSSYHAIKSNFEKIWQLKNFLYVLLLNQFLNEDQKFLVLLYWFSPHLAYTINSLGVSWIMNILHWFIHNSKNDHNSYPPLICKWCFALHSSNLNPIYCLIEEIGYGFGMDFGVNIWWILAHCSKDGKKVQ